MNAIENDKAVAAYVRASDSSVSGALAVSWPRWAGRRFVVFGDSWTTPLAGNVCIPSEAVGLLGGSVVKNYGVAGAKLAGTAMSANSLEQQANRAKTDMTVDKALVSDVLVIMGVNNLNGTGTDYLPDYTTLTGLFDGLRLYPNARYWYAANSKNMIVRSDSAAWNHYHLFQRAAADTGFAVSRWSPMWNWGREDLWPNDKPDARHMNETGQRLWARRLAAFLSGSDWRPAFSMGAADAFTPSQALLDIQSDVNVTGGTISIVGVSGEFSARQRVGYKMIVNNSSPVSMSYHVKSGSPTVTVTNMLLCTWDEYQASKALLDSIKYFTGDTMPLV